jgi:hypothetical protein
MSRGPSLLSMVAHYRSAGPGRVEPDGVTLSDPPELALMPVAWLDAYRWLFSEGVVNGLVIRAVNCTLTYSVSGLELRDGAFHLLLSLRRIDEPDPAPVPIGAVVRFWETP